MISKELIVNRLKELEGVKDRRLSDLNAIFGAIQECKHWIKAIEDEEKTARVNGVDHGS